MPCGKYWRSGRHRVARLMQAHGIRAKQARRFRVTTDSRHGFAIAPNRLGRQFAVATPNTVWMADVTYLKRLSFRWRGAVESPIDHRKQEQTSMKEFSTARCQHGLRSLLTVGGAAGVLFSTACAPTVDTAAIAKTLTQLDDDWSKAGAMKDVDSVASFYAADAIAYPPNEPIAIGQPAAKKVWASYFADSTFSISWKTDHAGASTSGDLGFTTGSYEDSFMGPDGKRVIEKGKYVCIWAKQADGSWKAIHDTWNTDAK